MSDQSHRLATGGHAIDRSRELHFTYDGRRYTGHPGDTLASALLANGVRRVARSFKYHRPRGLLSAGVEEPNALVAVGDGAHHEPNTRATEVELVDGLTAKSQNCWPSPAFDVRALTGLASPILVAGFYYKTFMAGGQRGWHAVEPSIRRSAGLGTAPTDPDPDHYAHINAHCDVLVAGAGPAGLAAARSASAAGARVIVADENPVPGGWLRGERLQVDGEAGDVWAARVAGELAEDPNVTLLPRTTVFGLYEHGTLGLVERPADPTPERPRQRMWVVRAHRVISATGAIERPLVFGNNDRPGVMLAGAVRHYLAAHGVAAGRSAVVVTNNDSAYRTALAYHRAGLGVPAVVDVRRDGGGALVEATRAAGIPVYAGHAPVTVRGRHGVRKVTVAPLSADRQRFTGEATDLPCDLVAVSGGWSPTIHLHAQAGGRPVFDERIGAFVPGASAGVEACAGAAAGHLDLATCLSDGARAGREAAEASGHAAAHAPATPSGEAEDDGTVAALWATPKARGSGKRFVDLQNDVTASDIALAHREGYGAVEHLKRYTTLGMGTDQGKTSNVNGHALLAQLRGESVDAVGTTTYRPPYTPVTFGALAGPDQGPDVEPLRRTPMDAWHVDHNAVFTNAGLWRRPMAYPRDGETVGQAAQREAAAVRAGVGMVDVSTLGKIDIQGPDAAEFLNRVYVNGWKRLAVGKTRYGLMLREDGMAADDGTTARLGETHFVMTTTTANAGSVMAELERRLAVDWPELRVSIASVTEQWATMAVAGPRSREVLSRVVEDRDLGNDAFPFMGAAEATIAGVAGRLFRISFSGELAYEVAVPADRGHAVWQAIMDAGAASEITPYGTEALNILRVEKGHPTGNEIDGRTSPLDLGAGRLLSSKKDFVGKRSLDRPAFHEPDRPVLTGLVPRQSGDRLRPGMQITAEAEPGLPPTLLGHVSSAVHSPELGHAVALAFVARGRERHGESLYAHYPLYGETVAVQVTEPVFVDPEGTRLHG